MYAATRSTKLDHSAWWPLAQQIRKSRATLGSILEWLESTDQDAKTLDSLYEYADNVRTEIDILVVAIATLPEKGKDKPETDQSLT